MRKPQLVAVGILIVGAVVVLTVRDGDERSTEAFTPPVAVSSAAPSVTGVPVVSPTTTAAVVSVDAGAELLARDAVVAWQNVDVPTRQALLQPLVIPELLDLYAYTDPSEVPQSPVQSTRTVNFGEGSTTVQVTLQDGTALIVTVEDVYANGHPLVTSINAG